MPTRNMGSVGSAKSWASELARAAPVGPLARATDRRAVTVTALAGWGKTALARQWAEHHDAWHGWLEPRHADPRQLAAYLAGHDPAQIQTRDLKGLSAWLVTQIEEAGHRWLVIDDSHVVAGTPSETLLRALMRHRPNSPRLMVVGRRPLHLFDDRDRASGAILELDATHLALDHDTVAGLVDRELDTDPGLAWQLRAATGGWPALVRLAIEGLHDVPAATRRATLPVLTGPDGPLAAYLRSTVVPDLSDEQRATLTVAAILGRADALAQAQVTEVAVPVARRAVHAMIAAGLCRRVGSADEPRVVPVLAEGVLATLRRVEDDATDAFITRLARTSYDDGRLIDTLRVLHTAGRHDGVATLMSDAGETLVGGSAPDTVDAALAGLSEAQRTPRLRGLQARVAALRGRWADAVGHLDAAGVAGDGPLPTDQAMALGLVHHLRGDLDAALVAYARGPEHEDGVEHATLVGWRATAAWLRGNVDLARRCAMDTLTAARQLDNDAVRALGHTAAALVAASDGDRRGNEVNYELALAAASRAGDVVQESRIRTNRGSAQLEHGHYDRALDETDRAINLAEKAGFAPILGVARCNRAEILVRTGRLDEAIAEAEAARETFASIGSHNESYALHLLGDARSERGDLVLAREAYERGLRLASISGDHQGLLQGLVGLAKALAGTDPDAACVAAERAAAIGAGVAPAPALLAVAWIAQVRGDADTSRRQAEAALAAARERDDRASIAEAVTCLAMLDPDPVPGLEEAARLWGELDAPIATARVQLGIARRSHDPRVRDGAAACERQLASWGCAPDGGTFVQRLVSGSTAEPRVSVRVLGEFAVSHAGRPVPASAWGSRKARELLKLLVTREGRGVSREELADLLWADEPYAAVSNRLSVALSVVRGLLTGPDRAGTDPIVVDGGVLRLNLDAVEIDLVRFRRLAEAGLWEARRGDRVQAIEHLLGAEEAYGGDLLEDDRDTMWLEERREELRSHYMAVVRTLAELVATDDPDLAMRSLLRLLDRDPYDEAAHLEVCRGLQNTGRHGEAMRRHRLYAARMDDLDLPAVPLTELRSD